MLTAVTYPVVSWVEQKLKMNSSCAVADVKGLKNVEYLPTDRILCDQGLWFDPD